MSTTLHLDVYSTHRGDGKPPHPTPPFRPALPLPHLVSSELRISDTCIPRTLGTGYSRDEYKLLTSPKMSTSHRNRTPGVLLPYLALPPADALTLITSTLSCTCNWLTARLIGSALQSEEPSVSVVLVSWLQDVAFWKGEIQRATGIDVSRSFNFTFIDCLSDALLPLSKSLLAATQNKISAAIDSASSSDRHVLLILDTPTMLFSLAPEITASDLSRMLLVLRDNEHVHSTILAVPSDRPYVSAATASADHVPTPLEIAHAGFTLQQVHSALTVMGCRELDTGAARDVSGVLRITRGGGWDDGDENVGRQKLGEIKDGQWRYLVGRDGTVKIVE